MANFLKKFVKAKSRSRSPVKHYYCQQPPLPNRTIGVIYDDALSPEQPFYAPIQQPVHHHHPVHHVATQHPPHSTMKLHRRHSNDLSECSSGENPTRPNITDIYAAYLSPQKEANYQQASEKTDLRSPKSSNRKKLSSLPPTKGLDHFMAHNDSNKRPVYDDSPNTKQCTAHPASPFLRNSIFQAIEGEPSSSKTLSPAWQSNNLLGFHKSFSQTQCPSSPNTLAIRPISAECLNGGAIEREAEWNEVKNSPRNSATDDYSTALTPTDCFANGRICGVASPNHFTLPFIRTRSVSPKKAIKMDDAKPKKYRSRSPTKRPTAVRTLDYLHAQCKLEGCSAAIVVEDTQFLVCKHQLSHASDFFRTIFVNNRALPVEGVKQTSINEYSIVVSGFKHPPQSVQFQWFIECTIPCPTLKSISDNSLETCMRLSRRFSAKGLQMRCSKFIQENVEKKPPMMALCWLNWVIKHRFDRATHDACLPVVARLSLHSIEKHRQMLPEKVISDLIAMKLRTCYQQAAKVFYTIHKMDHFYADMEKCPRCGRQREQGKIRVQGNPCQRLIGCDHCLREFGCEIEHKSGGDYEAFYQCDHGFWPFNDRTEDCQCQTILYRANFSIQNTQIVENNTRSSLVRAGDNNGNGTITTVSSPRLPHIQQGGAYQSNKIKHLASFATNNNSGAMAPSTTINDLNFH